MLMDSSLPYYHVIIILLDRTNNRKVLPNNSGLPYHSSLLNDNSPFDTEVVMLITLCF